MIGAVGPWGKGNCSTALVEQNSRLELGNSSLDVRFRRPSTAWPKMRCSLLSGNADSGVPAAVRAPAGMGKRLDSLEKTVGEMAELVVWLATPDENAEEDEFGTGDAA